MNFFLATDIGEEISEKVSENSAEKVSELSKLFDGFSSKMISLGINIINAVIIFIIGKIIIKLLRKLFKKIIGRTSADEAVVKFVDSIIKITGYFIVFIVICSELGIETTSFITVLGSAGVAIGLALQGSLSNFAGGVLFGTAGVKLLSSKDAKKVYTNCTAAVLRAKDSVMKTASTVQENAEDILAEAKQINEERAAKEAALEQEAEEVTEETVADNTDFAEEA